MVITLSTACKVDSSAGSIAVVVVGVVINSANRVPSLIDTLVLARRRRAECTVVTIVMRTFSFVSYRESFASRIACIIISHAIRSTYSADSERLAVEFTRLAQDWEQRVFTGANLNNSYSGYTSLAGVSVGYEVCAADWIEVFSAKHWD